MLSIYRFFLFVFGNVSYGSKPPKHLQVKKKLNFLEISVFILLHAHLNGGSILCFKVNLAFIDIYIENELKFYPLYN